MNIAVAQDSGFKALLQRLKAHIESGVALDEDDLRDCAEPACLVLAAMTAGSCGRFKGQRRAGPLAPLTHNAQVYERAEALARHISTCVDIRLTIVAR